MRKEVRARSGLKGLVLDLRNNPGGVLDAAVEVSDDFLDSGVIVTASGRGHESNFRHEAHAGDLARRRPDRRAGERRLGVRRRRSWPGALQDNKRATIMGSQTFGKGSVQTVMPLSNGRAIKLTTSRYYTPSGVSINGHGITPDVVLRGCRSAIAVVEEPDAGAVPDPHSIGRWAS